MTFEFIFDEYPSDHIVIQQKYLVEQRTNPFVPDTYCDFIGSASYARRYENGVVLKDRPLYTDEQVQERFVRPSLVDVLEFYNELRYNELAVANGFAVALSVSFCDCWYDCCCLQQCV